MAAFDNFQQTIERAKKLIEIHKNLSPHGKPKAEHADILRSAVVISVSAMDGYFHEKIPENVARLVRAKKGRQLPGKLVQTIKEQATHDKLIEILFEERPTAHITSMIRKSMKDRTYQDPSKIDEIIKILGLDDVWFKLSQKLKTSKDKSKSLVQGYVNRRHQIVHRGDYGQSMKTKNKLKNISRRYTVRCVNDISRFIKAIDQLVEAALEKN